MTDKELLYDGGDHYRAADSIARRNPTLAKLINRLAPGGIDNEDWLDIVATAINEKDQHDEDVREYHIMYPQTGCTPLAYPRNGGSAASPQVRSGWARGGRGACACAAHTQRPALVTRGGQCQR